MFYYLKGTLAYLTNDCAVIDCGGVGYKLTVSATTSAKTASLVGKEALLYTYLAVREDAVDLFGFSGEDELGLFKMLISVSGIGPKGAMAILGYYEPDSLRTIIYTGDAKSLSRAPGIGAKTAQRIIVDLKDKLGSAPESDFSPAGGPTAGSAASQVIDTLLLYGFERRQIEEALKKQDPSEPLEQLVADTLRTLGTM
ncbi:MAG: Holliday junction branch migration protein RuvA [Clostridia bacterium]|nr:Holliday junction branch migration protein RuvA [Clostridia bacterium]